MYVWGDVEVHWKLTSLNDGKHANFVRANVFSTAVSSPILAVVWRCTRRNVWGWANAWESGWMNEKAKKKESCFQGRIIHRYPSHVTGSKSKIYFLRRVNSIEVPNARTSLRKYFHFGNKWVLGPIFPGFSLNVLFTTCLKI